MSRERRSGPGSFTQQLTAELARHLPPLSCCRTSMLLGMRTVSAGGDTITTTRLVAARAAVQLAHAQGQPAHVVRIAAARRMRYELWALEAETLPPYTAETHCVRSALRGVLLAAARLVQPEAAPHLEIECPSETALVAVTAALGVFGIEPQVRVHRGATLLTVRRAASVGAVLSTVGAQTVRLDFEAGRVVREMRAGVNRRLNAETANLHRVAAAGWQQLEAAQRAHADPALWQQLAPALREAARLRIEHPDDDLARLAMRAGCSRPAMAGRLHRMVAAASPPVPVLP